MDRSSLHTSVVIEVANQEEPDDIEKTYHIDFDDLDVPKDYVIDQVFCGENITVYALFEVPEDSNVSSSDQMVDVTNQKAHDNYRFFQRNPSKKLMNHRKINGLKQNLMNQEESAMNIIPNNDNRSFYCLKHLSGDYGMLTPERKNSELKVLYSKTSSRDSKSTKFKAVSKGVNTDIVQSPKIINEVQKAVRQNLPVSKPADVKSISSSIPSYEVIEMEMRQSFSSMSSYGDSRKPSKKSVPNFFLVPLLMMDDGVLSHFQNDEKMQKLLEEKERKAIVPEKVSTGINTDIFMSAPPVNGNKQNENISDVYPLESTKLGSDDKEKQFSFNSHGKFNNRNVILAEIKLLQGKLNALIKSMESDAFDFDTNNLDSGAGPEELPQEKLDSSETTLSESKPYQTTRQKYDDLPILSSLTYPQCKTGKKKPAETHCKEQKENEVVLTKSNSVDVISVESSSKSQLERTTSIPNCQSIKGQVIKSKEELRTVPSNCSISWPELENRRGAGLSKSTTNGFSSLDFKLIQNGVKKSLSFDLRDVKLEVVCLKKIKNNSFKLETKANIRIPQKGTAIMKCEMGDEAFNKPKTSKIDLLSLSKPVEKVEDLKLEQKNLDPKKILKEEEGDAKLVYSAQNLLTQMMARQTENVEVHFCDSISITPKDNLLPIVENITPTPVKSKGICNMVEAEPKAISDTDKPSTPGKTSKRSVPPNQEKTKKEVKTVKKFNYQPNKVKQVDKTTKTEAKDAAQQDASKQRSVTGSRKFTLKGSAESKLHVDRLIGKSENPVSPKPNAEPGTKPGTKSKANQKRDFSDPAEENKEKTSKVNPILSRKENSSMPALERIGEDSAEEKSHEARPEHSGVVVELLSEKPSEKLCPMAVNNGNKNCTDFIKTLDGDVTFELNEKPQGEVSDDSLPSGKPVVKSVWALTKVLLFEDGSKKVEILEASLTPPGYSLPKTPTNDENLLN